MNLSALPAVDRPNVLLTAAIALALALLGPAVEARAACAGAAALPPAVSFAQVQVSTTCLVNEQRRAHGLRPLRSDPRLAMAAEGHAQDMARGAYFAHQSLDGRSFVDRLTATGYVDPRHRWTVGENLAWGRDERSEPGQIVAAWMASPAHRANILSPGYSEIGFGLAAARAGGVLPARAVYVTEFGARAGR